MKPWLSACLWSLSSLALIFTPRGSSAQLLPDNSLGSENSVVTPQGWRDLIEGGAARGSLLFHSFQDFNIGLGQSVYFAHPDNITNILTRVTGSNISQILGTLGVEGAANLFLLNPNGLHFGPDAHLDLAGSFYASTGENIALPGYDFSATNPTAPPDLALNITPGLQYPAGYQGDIVNAGHLAVGVGQTLSLQGNQVTHQGSLTAPGGTVEVLGHQLLLSPGSEIDVSGSASGGAVFLGGDFRGQGPRPVATNLVIAPGALIRANAGAVGHGGWVAAWAEETTAFYGEIAAQGGSLGGNGGLVEVSGKQTLLFRGVVDTQAVHGEAGTLLLDPLRIRLAAGAGDGDANGSNFDFAGDVSGILGQILGSDFAGGEVTLYQSELEGLAGDMDVILEALEGITIEPLVGGVLTFAPGTGSIDFIADANGDGVGDITMLNLNDRIETQGRDLVLSGASMQLGDLDTIGFSDFFSFNPAGNLEIQATGSVAVGNLLTLSSSFLPFFSLPGGNVRIVAGGDLQTQAIATQGHNAPSGSVELQAGGQLTTGTVEAGNSVTFVIPSTTGSPIQMTAGGDLTTGALSSSAGITLTAGGQITVAAANTTALGSDAGSVVLTAGRDIAVGDIASQTESFPFGPLPAGGSITLQAGGDVWAGRLGNLSPDSFSFFNSAAGAIAINANGHITTGDLSTRAQEAAAGPVTLTAGQGITTGQIATQAVQPTDPSHLGGDITLQAGGDVQTGNLGNLADIFLEAATGAIAIQAGGLVTTGNLRTSPGVTFAVRPGQAVTIAAAAGLNAQAINTEGSGGAAGGAVTLNSGGDLTAGDIRTGTESVTTVPRSQARPVTLTASGDLTVGQIYGGSDGTTTVGLRLQAGGNLTATTLSTARIDWTLDSDDIVAIAGGRLQVDTVSAFGGLGSAGAVTLRAGSDLVISNVLASSNFARGNDVSLQAGGDLRVQTVTTQGVSDGGALTLHAAGALQFQTLNSSSIGGLLFGGNSGGGNVTLSSGRPFTATNLDIRSDAVEGRGGTIRLQAPSINLINAQLNTEVVNTGVAGDIRFTATEAIRLQEGSRLASTVPLTGSGQSGNISLGAPLVELRSGSWLDTSTLGSGSAGNVRIDAGQVNVVDSFLLSATAGTGNAGQIAINAGDTVYLNNSYLSTAVSRGAIGQGGDIQVNAGALTLRNGAQIQALTQGQGASGTVQLNVAGSADFAGRNAQGFLSGVYTSTAANGFAGGDLTVRAGELRLSEGAVLSAQTFSSGNSGRIEVQANQVELSSGGQILTGTRGSGAAGDLRVQAGESLVIAGSDPNFASRPTLPPPLRASVPNIAPAASLVLAGSAQPSLATALDLNSAFSLAPASDPNPWVGNSTLTPYVSVQANLGSGEAHYYRLDVEAGTQGVFDIDTEIFGFGGVDTRLTLLDGTGTAIATSSQSTVIDAGSAGSAIPGSAPITNDPYLNHFFTASGTYYLRVEPQGGTGDYQLQTSLQNPSVRGSNITAGPNSGLFANTSPGSSGPGGSLQVRAPQIQLQDQGQIVVSSQGSGTGGSIDLQARNLTLAHQAGLEAETASAAGGNIRLDVEEILLLRHNSRISATAGTAQGAGDGGNIDINARFIIAVPKENSDITANAFAGNGGNITINAQGVFGLEFRDRLTPESDITASSEFGLQGNVRLNVLDIDPARGLSALPTELTDPGDRIQSTCDAVADGSTFTRQGQGGLPEVATRPLTGAQTWQDRRELGEEPASAAAMELEELEAIANDAPLAVGSFGGFACL